MSLSWGATATKAIQDNRIGKRHREPCHASSGNLQGFAKPSLFRGKLTASRIFDGRQTAGLLGRCAVLMVSSRGAMHGRAAPGMVREDR